MGRSAGRVCTRALAVVGLVGVALAMTLVRLQERAAAEDSAAVYDGPIIDSHAHLDAAVGIDPATLVALWDAVGVRGGWVFGYPWPTATAAWERFPDRVVPFLAEGYTTTLDRASSYRNPEGLETLLAGGYVCGLGEIILRHAPFRLVARVGGGSWPATDVPADHPELLVAYRVAGRHGAPVVVHQEAAFAAELERALAAAPETTFVWAHAGHAPAAVVRPLLERHPNLHADLSARTPWLGPGTVLTRGDGSLQPEWRALLTQYPERFLIGFDLFAPGHFEPGYVRDTAGYYRALLGRLDRAAAEQIAYRNAERLAPFMGPAAE